MADHVIHVSEAEAASDFAGLLARVRAGAEVVMESGKLPGGGGSSRRTACPATLDGDFARDLEEVINSHREPLNPPAWD
jgi:hypothetical protein